MKILATIIILIAISLSSFSQTSWHIGTYSPDGESKFADLGPTHAAYSLVYKIPYGKLMEILDKKYVLDFVKHTPVFDTLPFDAKPKEHLPNGNYIIQALNEQWVSYDYVNISNFKVQLYRHKGKKYIITVTDSLNRIRHDAEVLLKAKKKRSYNSEIKGFFINASQKQVHYLVKMDQQEILLAFQGNKQKYKFRNPRYADEDAGFIVLDKPIYRIGDTLHYKAFIYKKNKSYKGKAYLSFWSDYPENHEYVDIEVEPQSPSVFIGSIIIADSMCLNDNYKLSLYYWTRFNYEEVQQELSVKDYELDKYTLTTHLDKTDIYKSDSVEIKLSAKDFNGNFIKGARYKISISAQSASFLDHKDHFVPNTVYEISGALMNREMTKVYIKSEDLLNADANYTVNISTWSSRNEIKEASRSFKYSISPKLELKYKKDTIVCIVHNGDNNKLYLVYYDYQKEIELVNDSATVVIDYSLSVPSFILKRNDKTVIISMRAEPNIPYPSIYTMRNGNKLFIQTRNEHNIHLKLQIYEGSKLRYQSDGIKFDTIIMVNYNKDVYAFWRYQYNGGLRYEEVKLPTSDKIYTVELELADTISPGTEANLKIKVTDYKGKAVPNANITAHAVNSEFGNDISNVSFPQSSSKLRNSAWGGYYSLYLYNYYVRDVFNAEYRKAFSISNEQLHYKMRFPSSGFFIHNYPEAGHTCHFSPYLLSNGSLQKIYYVLIDKIPVYLDNYQENPWVFNYAKGKHTIEIRSFDKLYSITNVELKEGQKIDLFLDINNLPDSIGVINVGSKLSKHEQQMFQNFSKNISYDYFHFGNTLIQGNQIYKLNYQKLIAPIYGGDILIDKFSKFENYTLYPYNNSYEFNENGLGSKHIKYTVPKKLKKHRTVNPEYHSLFGSYAKRMFVDYLKEIEKPILFPIFMKPKADCKLTFQFDSDSCSLQNIYFKNLDNGFIYSMTDLANYYHIIKRQDIKSGNYRIIAFTNTNNILVKELTLKPNGWNYIELGAKSSEYVYFDTLARAQKDSVLLRLFYNNELQVSHLGNYSAVQAKSPYINLLNNYIKIFFFDAETKSMISPYYQATISVLDKEYRFARTTNFIPKNDSVYQIKFSYLPYKNIIFTINTQKINADFIYVYLEEETNELLLYKAGGPYYPVSGNAYGEISYNKGRRPYIRSLRKTRTINCTSFGYADEERIDKMPERDASIKAVIVGGTFSDDYGKMGGIRGARSQSYYNVDYLDGVRVSGNTHLPKCAIANESKSDFYFQMDSIATGGNPASFGDFSMGQNKSNSTRSNFNDVGFWVPNLITNKIGTAEVKVKFPDNITKWSVEVIAAGNHKELGAAYKTVVATKQQLARIETPRFLTQGDRCFINTELINYDNKPLKLKEYLVLNQKLIYSNNLSLDSFIIKKQELNADSIAVEIEYGYTAEGGIQDAEQRTIRVEPKGSWHAEGSFFSLKGDTILNIEAVNEDVKLVVYKDLLEVMLSDIERIKTYKYDCNEQKASKLIALLLQEQIDDYLGIKFKDENIINQLIRDLDNNQKKGFKWGWWKDSEPVEWISNHVIFALQMAGNQEYPIDYATLAFISLKGQTSNNPQLRYMSAINKLAKADPTLIDWNVKYNTVEEQLWNLKAKQAFNMNVSIDEVLALSHSTLKGGLYWGENNYSRTENKILCTSLAFELIREIDSTNAALERILVFLLAHHGFDRMNTYESAYMANAIIPYLLAPNSKLPSSTISDKSGNEIAFDKEIVIKAGESFTLNKKGSSKVFAMQYSQYFDAQPKQVDSLFKVQVQYYIDDSLVSSFTAGDQVLMKLNVIAKKQADYAMIEIPLPASCTYSNANIIENSHEVHREKYKEKLIIYCELLPEGQSTFQVELQARFPGTFNVNPASVKEMYYPFFFGRNGMKVVKVK